MASYISYPIETNPAALLQRIYDYLEANVPGWAPAEGNLDVWLSEAYASEVAELTDVASGVPDTVIAYLGKTVYNVPPIFAASAVVGSTWTMIDAAGYTIPSGTQVGITDADGNLVPFITVNTVVVPNGSMTTGAGAVALQAINPGTDANSLSGAVQLIDILSFVNTVATVGASSGGQDAETPGDYLSRLVTNLQLLSPTPILPADFSALALLAGTPAFRAVTIDNYNPTHNLLSANDASFETSVAGYTGTNAALAQSAAQAQDGVKSMSLTAASAADMSAELVIGDQIAVTPGDNITAVASFRSAVTARACKVGIHWYTSGNVSISTVFGATVNDTTTGWIQPTLTSVAPATAAFARPVVFVIAPANTEVHYIDEVMIRRGTTTTWVAGGTTEYNNPREVGIFVLDVNGAVLSGPNKTIIQNYINALRESGWITNVLDPTFNQIDVTVAVALSAGANSATVIASVTSAIQAYLNPATWGQATTSDGSSDAHSWTNTTKVYRYKLAQVIEEVDGVDHIVGNLLTGYHGTSLAEQDLGIGTPVGVATAGTITVTTV